MPIQQIQQKQCSNKEISKDIENRTSEEKEYLKNLEIKNRQQERILLKEQINMVQNNRAVFLDIQPVLQNYHNNIKKVQNIDETIYDIHTNNELKNIKEVINEQRIRGGYARVQQAIHQVYVGTHLNS